MIKVILDCNVFLQAIGKGGNHAFGCLELVSRDHVRLMMSQECLAEILEVLARPELKAILPGLTDERVSSLQGWIEEYAEFVARVPIVFRHKFDPKDEPYINLAIASGKSFLVSWDKHILSLRNADTEQGNSFAENYPSVVILTPKEFLDDFYKGNL